MFEFWCTHEKLPHTVLQNCFSSIYTYPVIVRIPLRDALDTTLCDKVCQWLAAGRWFSLGTPVSSTNKTDRHDITEILLKVALNTITLTLWSFYLISQITLTIHCDRIKSPGHMTYTICRTEATSSGLARTTKITPLNKMITTL